jgi:hypothetical protein
MGTKERIMSIERDVLRKRLNTQFKLSMSVKLIYCTALLMLVVGDFTTVAQSTLKEQKTVYRADNWFDIKGKGGFAKAADNPTYEKVEIIKTDTKFTVTLGAKVYNYLIVSSKPFSEFRTDYNVTLNGRNYVLIMGLSLNGITVFNVEGIWLVPETKDITYNNTDKAVLKFCKALQIDGGSSSRMIVYNAIQKVYPNASPQFYQAKGQNLYQDKAVLRGICKSFYEMGKNNSMMVFIQQYGLTAEEAELVSGYVDANGY